MSSAPPLSGQATRLADARALASLRVVVALLIVCSPELHQAPALAARPELLDFVPEGAQLFFALHLTPAAAAALRLLALSSGALAMLGFHSRSALALLTLSAMPLYALSQVSGAVVHDMHLFWFSGLLALSPCGDTWALDSWGERPLRSAREYALPAAIGRAFLGVIYFFPGFHKLLESGWDWASAQHVIAQMHAKWFQFARVPWPRIDHHPWLCSLGGHAVLLFELGFFPLAARRKTRTLAAVLGLAFHWSTQAFLFIPFVSLWGCYVLLAPWHRLARGATVSPPAARDSRRPRLAARAKSRAALPAALFGALVLGLAIVQGVRGQTQAWPIACYPTFAKIAADTLPDLLVEVESPGGDIVRFNGREHGPRTQAEWGRVFRISGAYGNLPNPRDLREHAFDSARRARISLVVGSVVRVFRANYATAPELWNLPPRHSTLLSTFRVES